MGPDLDESKIEAGLAFYRQWKTAGGMDGGHAETEDRGRSRTDSKTSDDEPIDASMLDADDPEQTPLVDTSDFDFSRSADLCSHINVIETDGVVVCQDCNCELLCRESRVSGMPHEAC